MGDRVILHCDCNSFYASVESVLNPDYKNVPMAVCGNQADRHGIVLAKNELAKKYNIKTAETVFSAKKKCPELVIAEPHHEEYVKFSKRVNDIYFRYTDMVEPFGIDESWLDVTASRKLFGTGYEIAEKIRTDIKREIGITVSIGVSFNKVFSKLGSDYKKPDAITVIDRSNYKSVAYPLPVSSLLFVGKKTEKVLFSMGVRTIGALAEMNPSLLRTRLGKLGEMLYDYANGNENNPVAPIHSDAKSISNGLTFKHDLVGRAESKLGIEYLSDEIGRRLRSYGLKCGTVSLTIKDEFLRTIQRQRPQLPYSDISREIANTAYSILLEEWDEEKHIRMITVSVTNLVRNEAEQIELFDKDTKSDRNKSEKREKAIDNIRQKYGNSSIITGAVIDSDIGIYTRNEETEKKIKNIIKKKKFK